MKAIAQAVNNVEGVENVEQVKDNYADVVVTFEHPHQVQSMRVEWLENWRDEFEIVGHNKHEENSWMQFKAK